MILARLQLSLSIGQIYLYGNPLLKRPLALADVEHKLLGHWGTTPGQNLAKTSMAISPSLAGKSV